MSEKCPSEKCLWRWVIKIIFFNIRQDNKAVQEILPELKNSNFEVDFINDANECIQFVGMQEGCIVLMQYSNKNELVSCISIVKSSAPKVKNSLVKVAAFSTFKVTKAEQQKIELTFRKLGCNDFLEAGLNKRAFKYKIDLWAKAIEKLIAKNENTQSQSAPLEAQTSGSQQAKMEKTGPTVKFVKDMQYLDSDCWIIQDQQDAKVIVGKFYVKMVGPGPYAITWDPHPKNPGLLVLRFNEKFQKDFMLNKGWWILEANKPEFNWQGNFWTLGGPKINLFFEEQGSGERHFKIRTVGQCMEVNETSPHALKKQPLIWQTFEKDLEIKSEAEGPISTEEIEGDLEKMDGSISKKKTADRMSSHMRGNNSINENIDTHGIGEGLTDSLNTSPMTGTSNQRADNTKPMVGETSSSAPSSGPMTGETSGGQKSTGPMTGTLNSSSPNSPSMRGDIQNNQSQNAPLMGQVGSQTRAGNLKGDISSGPNSNQGPLQGDSIGEAAMGGNLQGNTVSTQKKSGNLNGEISSSQNSSTQGLNSPSSPHMGQGNLSGETGPVPKTQAGLSAPSSSLPTGELKGDIQGNAQQGGQPMSGEVYSQNKKGGPLRGEQSQGSMVDTSGIDQNQPRKNQNSEYTDSPARPADQRDELAQQMADILDDQRSKKKNTAEEEKYSEENFDMSSGKVTLHLAYLANPENLVEGVFNDLDEETLYVACESGQFPQGTDLYISLSYSLKKGQHDYQMIGKIEEVDTTEEQDFLIVSIAEKDKEKIKEILKKMAERKEHIASFFELAADKLVS